MPIQSSDLIWRPAKLVSDSTPAQNGGVMRFDAAITSEVKNNLLPDVSRSEREAGAVTWRKAFIHAAAADSAPLQDARIFLDQPTPAEDFVLIYPGTPDDTEAEIAARPYGIGTLGAALSPADASVSVVGEHAAYATLQPFRIGDLLRIADRPAIGGAGNEVFVSVTSVSWEGAEATLGIEPPLAVGFAIEGTVVSAVIEAGALAAGIGDFTPESDAGTFNAGRAEANARGTPDDAWVLTFTSASAFTASGLATGPVGTGNISGDFAPTNPASGQPFFRLRMDAWGGTWQTGDTLSFSTASASTALWYRREVPAGAESLAGNAVSVAIQGEGE